MTNELTTDELNRLSRVITPQRLQSAGASESAGMQFLAIGRNRDTQSIDTTVEISAHAGDAIVMYRSRSMKHLDYFLIGCRRLISAD